MRLRGDPEAEFMKIGARGTLLGDARTNKDATKMSYARHREEALRTEKK